MRVIEINSLCLQRRGDHLTHDSAAELHAVRRLHERYGVPLRDAVNLMMDHLAVILAGEGEYRGRQSRGRDIYRLEHDGEVYWLAYDDRIKRIVTYLTPTVRVSQFADRAAHRRKPRRLHVVGDDE